MKTKTLKELRISKGLTQEQASKLLDINKNYLSMVENKLRNPSDRLKEKMSKLYKVEIVDIFLAINSTKRLNQERR